MRRKWVIAPQVPEEVRRDYPELPDVVLSLLWNRGIRTQKEIDEFLNPDWGEDIHSPFLFRDMEKAVQRIFDAIKNDEKIVIHGDYDADGVCGSVILFETLKTLGAKNLEVFLPHREIEGYGVNLNTIRNFYKDKVNLIITCDCGISNFNSIKEAKELGMDVIITDHHEIPENIPPAFAILHPKMFGETYPHKELSGGAVAWKLACGLIYRVVHKNNAVYGVVHKNNAADRVVHKNNAADRVVNNNNAADRVVHKNNAAGHASPFKDDTVDGLKMAPDGFEKWLLDLVAISLIADVIPLLGEARTLAKYGLIVLNKTRNLGLKYLFKAAGIEKGKIDTWTIGFVIAPRLNAAGRMNHANAAYKLLVSKDETEAKRLADELNKSNSERQKETELITMEAKGEIIKNEMDKKTAIAVFGNEWPVGLLGLVAGKLSSEFYRPTVVCTKKEGKIIGSGRCEIKDFNLLESLRSLQNKRAQMSDGVESQETFDFFEKLGGHKSACGFTLKQEVNFDEFYKYWEEECAKRLKGIDLTPVLFIDSELCLDDIDWELYDILSRLEPFGEGNHTPRYLARNVTVKSLDLVGNNGNHLRLWVQHKGITTKKMIGFCLGDPERAGENWCQKLKINDKIDVVFEVGINEWNGNRELQLKIIDLRLCE